MAKLEWLEIKDFTPGIFDTVTPNNPPGTATRENTFKCIASENGALIPMPRRVANYEHENLDSSEPSSDGFYFIGGLFVADPIFDGTTPVGPDQNNSEIFMAFEWFDTTTSDRRQQIRRYQRHSATQEWETVFDKTSADQTYDANYRPARCVFQSSRSNRADDTIVGVPVVIMCYDGILEEFPDDQNAAVTDTFAMPKPADGFPQPSLIISHQNRVVVFPLTLYAFGQGEVYATNEGIYWTAANDVGTNDAGDFTNVVFGSENPTGYQCGASLSANELLLLKSKGGGLLLRGDLGNVTAINLPNVFSPGFSDSHGCRTKIGYAYCIDNGGMYVWQGGDSAEDISLQLASNFWRPTDQVGDYYRSHTTCTKWGNWIATPNNWLFDIDRGGWWRFDDPSFAELYHLDSDWTGRWLYGSRHKFSHDAEDQFVFHEYDRQLGAVTYSWQSHPIPATMERTVQIRECILVMSGHGDFEVTCIGREGETDTQSYTVDDDFPVAMRGPLACKGTNIQVHVVSTANNEDDDPLPEGAPVLHAIRLGLAEREHMERPE